MFPLLISPSVLHSLIVHVYICMQIILINKEHAVSLHISSLEIFVIHKMLFLNIERFELSYYVVRDLNILKNIMYLENIF